jgi:HD-GYP domain-containing protein (c-di-GMP phosphodiesterase class II)
MVRFSDIIRLRDKKDADKKQPAPTKHEEGFRLSDSPLFTPVNIPSPVIKEDPQKRRVSVEVGVFYNIFIERVQETGDIIKGNMPISPSTLLSDLHGLLEKGLVEDLYEYALARDKESCDLTTHTVDVTFTALKIGKALNYDMKMMMRLGLAAMLENAGMYMIPESILSSTEKLSDADIAIIKKHPETGHNILFTLGERYNWLAETARCVHERADGSGYPRGLKGDSIPELASILGIADTFCAMISKRPYRAKFLLPEAVSLIAETGKGLFHMKPLKAFLDQVSLFPVNSCVKLNNGSIGRVISTNRFHPLSPVLEIIMDKDGRKTEEVFQIDLVLNPLLHIEKCIEPETMTIKENN